MDGFIELDAWIEEPEERIAPSAPLSIGLLAGTPGGPSFDRLPNDGVPPPEIFIETINGPRLMTPGR